MEVDLSIVNESEPYSFVDPGVYSCRIGEVRPRETQAGSPLWAVKLVVCKGQDEGRVAAWDNIVWSPKGMGRVKMFLRVLGFPVEGMLKIEPEDILGKRVRVSVIKENYRNPSTGETAVRNAVPYYGYFMENEESGEIPF